MQSPEGATLREPQVSVAPPGLYSYSTGLRPWLHSVAAIAAGEIAMAILIHEIWEHVCDGMVLHSCCLTGPGGDVCRGLLEPNARLLTTFEAGSHFEAMTIYNRYLRHESYTTREPWDFEPYPDEWLAEQNSR
jgi:hypothetical protein